MIAPVQPGQILSRKYLLRKRLAEGGMGEVWLARNQRTQGDCAIKVLLPSLARNAEALRRFVQEARATGQLKHSGIVQVFDAGKTSDGRPYLTMELLVGQTLADRLHRDGRVAPPEACVLLSQVARAAQHAHQRGVVHRDLSTGNVFLVRSADGGTPTPKILDFGVSKMADAQGACTLTGALLGSPAYMSPEQAEGADGVDARTDVWSLGVLLYQCLSGRLPFDGRNHNSTMLAVISKPHGPIIELMPELDSELGDLVEGCLTKDREERVQTAAEVANTLERVARRLVRSGARFSPRRRLSDRLPPEAPNPGALPLRGGRGVGRGGIFLAVGTGIVGTALGVLIGATWAGVNPRSEAPARTGRSGQSIAVDVMREQPGYPAEPDSDVQPREALPRDVDVDLAKAVAEGLGVERR